MNPIRPEIFHPYLNLIAAQSTREGGISPVPYDSLNLGNSTNDNPENVDQNRHRFFSHLGYRLSQVALSRQIHGSSILKVEMPGIYDGFDALMTNQTGILIGVSIADCAPILLHDPKKQVIAAVHAGWRGAKDKILSKTIIALHAQYGSNPADILMFIGACIGSEKFEVGEEVAEAFDPLFSRESKIQGKFLLDLKSALAKEAEENGVKRDKVEISTECTASSPDRFFSHRKSGGITGRMLAVIGLK
ncbi:MAG: peptidoglycan editing factor PgeF [Chloroherpetonaceae bacterium]|nr:peptidoglycan editing factor PgeF [Chloroherpetonaceae bacterium]